MKRLMFISIILYCCSKDSTTQSQYNQFQVGDTQQLKVNETLSLWTKFDHVVEQRLTSQTCSLYYGQPLYVYAYFVFQKSGSKTFDTLKLHRVGCIPAGDLKIGNPAMDVESIYGIKIGLIDITERDANIKPANYTAKISLIQN
ncbi:MAG: hypothetical protein JST69_02360 [Bacteroidetes bacterium]|nr:hypothetical protein [Bacteroidota bacterium]